MQAPTSVRRFALSASTALAICLFAVACGGSESAGWTYAPLGPTPDASAPASAPASGAPSPGASPDSSPGGSPGAGTEVAITTTAANPLGYDPAQFAVPAGANVTINYTNESNLPHDVQTFAGQDSSSEVLGATEEITGPGAQSSATFTAPTEPGDYFFWCSVHQSAMTGTYTVQ
jgi:plastocyanin